MSKIPLSVPNIGGNEWKYIKECLDTEWVSSAGKYVDLFEKNISKYTGSKYSIACTNGTSALQVALQLSGVNPGDEVIVPTLTFIAPVNAISYNNAKPIFMDVDKYYNIDSDKTIDFINKETIFRNGKTFNKFTGNHISAIIPVHVWGNACNLDDLYDVCINRNITVVEDASEALGTIYTDGNFKNRHAGTIGVFGCLSFNGNKLITSGGGGMILTDNEDLAIKAKYITTQAKDDPISYKHNEIGYNFRLTNIQAALGVAQLERIDFFLKRKKFIYKLYLKNFSNSNTFSINSVPNYANNNHWISLLQVNHSNKDSIGRIMGILNDKQIETRPVWSLNHLQTPYKNCQSYKVHNAEKMVEKSLCLPSSTNLVEEDLFRVLDSICE